MMQLYSKTFTIFQSLQQIAAQTSSEGSGFGAAQSYVFLPKSSRRRLA